MRIKSKAGLLSYLESLKKWGSVRKIRFKNQIFAFFQYASNKDGRPYSLDDICNLIAEARMEREKVRMKITQEVTKAIDRIQSGKGNLYRALASDNVSFARKVGIFDIVNGKVRCNERAKNIASVIKTDPEKAQDEILKLLLNSVYVAYIGFIEELQRRGGSFIIPGGYCSRTRASNLSEYLKTSGFKTDVASFYTIRDLLYDFEIINWTINQQDGSEHIFLTSYLTDSAMEKNFKRIVSLNSLLLLYSRNVNLDQFEECVMKEYLSCTRGSWGRIVNLIDFRDRVSEKLRISDQDFNKLILAFSRSESGIIISFSQGVIPSSGKRGYLIKATNLPVLDHERRATYLRVHKKNSR